MTEKLPKTLKVLHRLFKVSRNPSLSCGHIDYGSGDISIETAQKGSEEVDTLLHEVLHALCRYTALELNGDEERVVSALASGLTTVLKDNPKFIDYIKDSIND